MENMTFSGFGDLLKTYRKRRGLTQKELATLMGVHRNTIGTWELGDFLPESKTIVLELARQLQLDTDDTRRLLEASLTALSPYWHVPYQRNPFFTGREDVLHHLHEALTQDHSALLSQSYALSGLGGIGKTQVAIEYAYRYADDYTAVFWVSAETVETIISSMVVIADTLNLAEKQEQVQEKVVTAVMRWFGSHKDWLLIFDNSEDPAQIKPFLPPTRSGSLLFTSRRQSLGLTAQTLTLAGITPEEGARLLTQRARILHATASLSQLSARDTTLAQEIVTAMDGLPLALDQAGAYIEATQCSLSDYVQLFQLSQVRLLEERDAHNTHPLSVTKTFALAFEQLEKNHPSAAEMLTVCAHLAPEEIPEMFFMQGAALLGPTFEKLAADPFAFHATLKELLLYSLIQRNTGNATLSIHRLVQAVLKAHISETMQHVWITRVLHAMAQLFPSYEARQNTYWKVSEQLLPHALMCIALSEQLDEDSTLHTVLITLMSHVASYLSIRARYVEAETLFKRALLIGKQTLEPQHFLLSELLNELANLYRMQGRNENAELLFIQALQIREQTLGLEHPSIATLLNNFATLYFNQGKYLQAETLYRRALSILEQTSVPNQYQITSICSNLATIYTEKGEYNLAESLLQQALNIQPQLDDLAIAHPLCNLASCYCEQGKYEQAISRYQQALHIWEQRLGDEHPQVTAALHGLAITYYHYGMYEQAEHFDQRALSIRERILGPEHSDVATSLNLLASILRAQRKHQRAEPLFQRALHIWEKSLGPEHVYVARPLNNLANLYIEQGKYKQAEPLYLRALHIREQVHGLDHPYLAHPLNGLANCYFKQGQYEQAEPLYQRALQLREDHLGQHPETAETFSDFAAFQEARGNDQEALSLYQRTFTIRERSFGEEHPETLEARAHYERLLKRVEQASTMSKKAEMAVGQSRDEYPLCPSCQRNDAVVQSGVNRTGTQRFRCRSCQRYFTPGARPRGYDASIKAQARTLTQAGVSTRDVAQQLNIHHSTVSHWAKENQQ